MLVSALLLSIAVSIDGFSAGFAYGIRSLKIPFFSLLIISLSSAGAMMVSMVLGKTLSRYLPVGFAPLLGGAILLVLGGWVIVSGILDSKEKNASYAKKRTQEKKAFFWQHPERADLDDSGIISWGEALLLGSILATDAFAAGFGASLMGFPPLLTGVFVGLNKITMVAAGLSLGQRSVKLFSSQAASLTAGCILAFMGLLSIIT